MIITQVESIMERGAVSITHNQTKTIMLVGV